jgi:SAM-dependent methyltransferase
MDSQTQPWHRIAPRLGSDAEFAAVRGMLAQCGFTEKRVFERLGIPGAGAYKPVWLGGSNLPEAKDALDALILLLMDGDYVEGETPARLLPAGAVEQLEALRLICRDPQNPEKWFGGCTLFPTRGLLLASDRASSPDGTRHPSSADMVYPPAIETTAVFVSTLPETPCDALLDLCTGSGVAALDFARYARHAWGTDIAARSVQFAEFNRRLNGIQNVTILEGDLYAPVEGLTFDRIVAHPPYVPVRKNELIFRDGGEDGEQILRRIVEDVPRFLRPGGRFYTIVTAADCEGQAFEDRLRLWLGPHAAEFDLVLVAHTERQPKDVAVDSFLGGNTPAGDIRYRHDMWERRKTKSLFHGRVLMRRHEAERPAFTQRVLRGQGFTQAHVEWLLEWGAAAHDAASQQRLMDLRPCLSPHAELGVIHRVRNGRFVPEGFSLRCRRPFDAERVLPPWLAQIVAQCDGRTSWQGQLENARSAGLVSREVTAAEFLSVLEPLVSKALLWVAERPLPGCRADAC